MRHFTYKRPLKPNEEEAEAEEKHEEEKLLASGCRCPFFIYVVQRLSTEVLANG